MLVPFAVGTIAVLLLVFAWRLGREGRRRYEYWKGVYRVWKRNERSSGQGRKK